MVVLVSSTLALLGVLQVRLPIAGLLLSAAVPACLYDVVGKLVPYYGPSGTVIVAAVIATAEPDVIEVVLRLRSQPEVPTVP